MSAILRSTLLLAVASFLPAACSAPASGRIPVTFTPDISGLSAGDDALYEALAEVCDSVDRLHRVQFDADSSRGVYPAGLDQDRLRSFVARNPDGGMLLRDPRHALRDRGASFDAAPYSSRYESELEEISAGLLRAADLADDPALRQYLRACAQDFLSDDFEVAERAWAKGPGSLLLCWFGPSGVNVDDLLGVKTGYEGWVGVRDAEGSVFVAQLGAAVREWENKLQDSPKLNFDLPSIHVVNDVRRAGALDEDDRRLAILPYDEEFREEQGRVLVYSRNVQAERARLTLPVLASAAFLPATAEEVTPDAAFHLLLGHYFAHAVGPEQITVGGQQVELKEHFGDIHGVLEEAKAEIVSALMCYELAHSGAVPETLQYQYGPTWVLGQLRLASDYLRGDAPETHGKAAFVILNFLRDSGRLQFRFDRWLLDEPRPVLELLLTEILDLQAAGDVNAAGLYIHEKSALDARMREGLRELGSMREARLETSFRPQRGD